MTEVVRHTLRSFPHWYDGSVNLLEYSYLIQWFESRRHCEDTKVFLVLR